MSRTIHCVKLNREAESLSKPPLPGPLGERIYQNISKEAWQLWIKQQTMLINEYHLKMSELKARQFIMDKMEEFLFGNNEKKS